MSKDQSCTRSHGALLEDDRSHTSNLSHITANKSLMGSIAPSVGTSDDTIVRRGDGKIGKQKENMLTCDHVGRQTSDLGLTLSTSDNNGRSIIKEEESNTFFCCCLRKRRPMIWL
jgi:hypothetical protein